MVYFHIYKYYNYTFLYKLIDSQEDWVYLYKEAALKISQEKSITNLYKTYIQKCCTYTEY